jgi:O-antigen ligase
MNPALKNSSNLIESLRSYPLLHQITVISICLLPIFHLTFNNWTGIWMVSSALLSLISILSSKDIAKSSLRDKRTKWMILCLSSYPLATLLSQICRQSFTHKAYLDISPFLYFIPILIFVVWRGFDFGKWLQIILPIVILGAGYSCYFIDRAEAIRHWGGNRLTPSFSDPLAFGQIILTLGLLSLSNINLKKWNLQGFAINTWAILGFLAGTILSIKSGSRTGWIGLPISLFIILIFKMGWSMKKSIPIATILTIFACFAIYLISSYAQARINLAINEIITYPWNGGVASENSSVGERITFQRLGFYYFSHSPIYGWGDKGYSIIKDSYEVLKYSNQNERDFVFGALFHNELMTQMVRYGILGILGYFLAVFTPLIIGFKSFSSSNEILKRSALMLVIFIICQITAGLSDEFLNLKGMVAFYSYMITVLIGTVISLSIIEKSIK